MKQSKFLLHPMVWLVASLTLGLAPFVPEPHIWEKLKWLAAGANEMKPIDWFDLILHSAPWIMLMWSTINHFTDKN